MNGLTGQALSACYSTVANIIGLNSEPLSVIQRVEKHRRYWRPAKTRVILLAESHVYTEASELAHALRPSLDVPPDLPKGFVRLVYCLGYGENGLLDAPIAGTRNSGTPQFWKIFASCLKPVASNDDFAGILASRTLQPDRLVNKLALLYYLKARGIWLVDASIAALYAPGRPKLPPNRMLDVLYASWDGYVCSVIEEANPQAIICIGLGVAGALRTRLISLGIPWTAVPQPNARLSTAQHLDVFRTYYRICEQPEAIVAIQPSWVKTAF